MTGSVFVLCLLLNCFVLSSKDNRGNIKLHRDSKVNVLVIHRPTLPAGIFEFTRSCKCCQRELREAAWPTLVDKMHLVLT